MEYCDAHLHLADFNFSDDYLNNYLCTSTHIYNEFLKCKDIQTLHKNVKISFGIHPQNIVNDNIQVLENLLKNNQIDAIGECGIDLFTDEYKQELNNQKRVFALQLELASYYQKPVIIHCRKAINILFEYSSLLKKIPSVVFHSFPGSIVEANSFINKGINSFFSFGSPILNNRRLSLECVQNLPLEFILLETDSPYQLLKDEIKPKSARINEVYKEVVNLRNIEIHELQKVIRNNFIAAYGE